jgi:hypothetical protein
MKRLLPIPSAERMLRLKEVQTAALHMRFLQSREHWTEKVVLSTPIVVLKSIASPAGLCQCLAWRILYCSQRVITKKKEQEGRNGNWLQLTKSEK